MSKLLQFLNEHPALKIIVRLGGIAAAIVGIFSLFQVVTSWLESPERSVTLSNLQIDGPAFYSDALLAGPNVGWVVVNFKAQIDGYEDTPVEVWWAVFDATTNTLEPQIQTCFPVPCEPREGFLLGPTYIPTQQSESFVGEVTVDLPNIWSAGFSMGAYENIDKTLEGNWKVVLRVYDDKEKVKERVETEPFRVTYCGILNATQRECE